MLPFHMCFQLGYDSSKNINKTAAEEPGAVISSRVAVALIPSSRALEHALVTEMRARSGLDLGLGEGVRAGGQFARCRRAVVKEEHTGRWTARRVSRQEQLLCAAGPWQRVWRSEDGQVDVADREEAVRADVAGHDGTDHVQHDHDGHGAYQQEATLDECVAGTHQDWLQTCRQVVLETGVV